MVPKDLVAKICYRLLVERDRLDMLDATCGDGETGTNLARGAEAVLDELKLTDDVSLKKLGFALNSAGCGTLGTIWSFLLIQSERASSMDEALSILEDTFREKSDAEIGDKTMADVLFPWIDHVRNEPERGGRAGPDWLGATVVAGEAAVSTRDMAGKKGRGKYAGERSMGCEDPGAWATAIVLDEISGFFLNQQMDRREKEWLSKVPKLPVNWDEGESSEKDHK